MKPVRTLGYIAAADILSLFISFTLALSSGIFMRIISAVCTAGILICFMINHALSAVHEDINAEKKSGTKTKLRAPVLLGITASLPSALCWIILFFTHSSDRIDFYRWHKILNAYFLQIYNFINSGASSSGLSNQDILLMLPLVFIPMLSFIAAYFTAYRKNTDCLQN